MKKTKRPDADFTVSVQDACEDVGISPATMVRKVLAGFVEGRQFGLGQRRRWWFHPSDVEWMKKQYPQNKRKRVKATA